LTSLNRDGDEPRYAPRVDGVHAGGERRAAGSRRANCWTPFSGSP